MSRAKRRGGDTELESVADIRRTLKGKLRPTAKEEAETTRVFRPVLRPPMARLCVLDDGGDDGEWFRVRQDRITIGRSDCDVCVPHDLSMSAHHASITRTVDSGRFGWLLEDLGSTNGIYVRISKTVVKHGAEVLLGGRRFRFDGPGVLAVAAGAADEDVGTRMLQPVSRADLESSLVELTPDGDGDRVFLKRPDNWIGRDPSQANIHFDSDVLLSPRHARLYRDEHGAWHLENAGSRNGTWLRTSRFSIDRLCQFQLGEQRFLFKVQS